MKVFNTFFKILKKNIVVLIMYIVIFLAILISITSAIDKAKATQFNAEENAVKANIAVFNHDKNSEFSNNFEKFLRKNANVIDIKEDKQTVQDSLYFGDVLYIVIIPENFAQKFKANSSDAKIQKNSVAVSIDNIYMDLLINKYLNCAKTYLNTLPNLSDAKLNEYINQNMNIKANVSINTFGKEKTSENITYYFNYLAYIIFAVNILGVATIMSGFNNTEIQKRNIVAPIKQSSFNLQIILASIVYTGFIWLLMCTIGIILFSQGKINQDILLFSLNALILSIVALAISFLIGNVVKSKNAVSTLNTIISLGFSFMGGVFVPQEIMSASILNISKIIVPVYWYVKNIFKIESTVNLNSETLKPILFNMGIQLIFAIVIFTISIIYIQNQRRKKEFI